MLEGLLGRGFSSKCDCCVFLYIKSLIKPTRTRIEVLRKRKEATQRFLKGNLFQLLSNGLDINAFGRTEEFLAGLNVLACYDFLDHCCEYILKKLSMMQKQSECPEDCREAVGSLMFAAARFSDLPELRDLRDALQERYGSSLEHFVNQEFVERLAMKPSTADTKIQLLQDIASELPIKWDSRGFQQRMVANPSAPAQNQAKKQEPVHDSTATYKLRIDNETVANSNNRVQLIKERSDLTSDRLKAKKDAANYLVKKDELFPRSYIEDESTAHSSKPHLGSELNTAKRDNYDMTPQGRREKGELGSDELQTKLGRGNYIMRRDEAGHRSFGGVDSAGRENYLVRKDAVGHRSFGGVESTGNRKNTGMASEYNSAKNDNYDRTPRERLHKGELSSDELRPKNGRESYLMRKDEWSHVPFGEVQSNGNSGKPHMASEQNTSKRSNYDVAPQSRREKGELSSDELREKNGTENYLSFGKLRMGSKHNTHKKDNFDVTPVGRPVDAEFSSDGLRGINGREKYAMRIDEMDHLSFGRGDSMDTSHKSYIGSEERTPQREICDITSRHRREHSAKTLKTIPVEDIDTFKFKPSSGYALPPPYVKLKDKLVPPPYMKTVEAKTMSPNSAWGSVDPIKHKRDGIEGRSERSRSEEDYSNDEELLSKIARGRSHGHEKNVPYRDNIPLPKPRSIRRKHSKSSTNRDDLGDSEDSEVVKRSSSSRRRDQSEASEIVRRSASSRRRDHQSKKGLQILFDDEHKQNDDEERKIDKLLLHYCKKPSYDEEKVRKPHAREAPHNGVKGEQSGIPTRSVSLPREQNASKEQVKVYARANSFQPDKPTAHVHPKLPDYDDLAAQFAAMKGRGM